MRRRQFLKLSAASAAAAALGLDLGCLRPATPPAAPTTRSGLKLLVLGGTSFLGPAFVEEARRRGHTLTLFNRGKTNPGLFAGADGIEQIHGDRHQDLSGLKGRTFDAVIDTSGYFPKDVEALATLLRDAVKQYVFISSVSVYADMKRRGMDETAAVAKLPAGNDGAKITEETYGPLKALCEEAAERIMPGRVTNVRPGLIVGPRDPSDRFTYWPVRLDRGGDVLAPGAPSDPVLLIDVRDLGAWLVTAVEKGIVGVYNALGPTGTLGMGDLLAACRAATTTESRLVWADAKFLEAQKITPWMDMPVWVPPDGDEGGMGFVSRARAVEKGLTFRPLVETARDTLAWWKTLPEERRAKLRAGISAEREAAAIAAWKARPVAPVAR